jgi:hypothetical protein
MRRHQPACLALALLLMAVSVANAQLGALKKKAVDKATGKDTVATAAKAKPKCDASSMAITADVVDRYLKSMAARNAEMQRLAKEPGKTGAYYSAVLQRETIYRRKADYDLHKGPDWEKHKALQKRFKSELTSGKDPTATMQEDNALTESLNPGRVQIPDLDWQSQERGNFRMDSTQQAAGKFSDCDWTDLGERLPRTISMLVSDPKTKDFQGYVTEKEAAAIRPRIPELARAMGMNYVSPEDEARLKKEKEDEEAQAAAAAQPSTGDPRLDCMAKVQGEWSKRHKKELDAAQGDAAALMKLSMDMNSEAMAKCQSE